MEDEKILSIIHKRLGDTLQVIQRLGGGEFSNVYLVRRKDSGKELALKILDYNYLLAKLKKENPAGSKQKFDEIKRRFLAEAGLYEKIDHPNIVKIHDTGVIADDERDVEIPYFMMDYIEGASLDNVIDNDAPLKLNRAVRIAQHILSALEVIHQHNIIHRDLKPANIMIEKKTGKAVLIDFGISKDVVGSTRLTTTGAVMGSPRYMAPEQFEDSSKVGPKIDIYSFGVVLYEMLMGEPPFKGTNFLELMNSHRRHAVPSVRAAHSHYPPGIDPVIAGAMAKDPSQRFAGGAEILNALDRMDETPTGRRSRKLTKVLLPLAALMIALFFIFYPFGGPKESGTTAPPAGAEPTPTVATPGAGETEEKTENIQYTQRITAAKEAVQEGKLDEALELLNQAKGFDDTDEVKELIQSVTAKHVENMRQAFDALKTSLETETDETEKAGRWRAFREKYKKLPSTVETGAMISRADDFIAQAGDRKTYEESITAARKYIEAADFKNAQTALAAAGKIDNSDDVQQLSQTLTGRMTQHENTHGESRYNALINTVDLAAFLKFQNDYPQSLHLPALKERLKELDPGLPPEKYWQAGIQKNKRGRYEIVFGEAHNRHRMIYITGKRIWIDKYEVSNRQFRQYLKDAGLPSAPGTGNKFILDGDNYPAVVTYAEAVEYCRRYGLKLPRTHQWEHAAGGGGRTYPWGDQLPGEDGVWRANFDTLDGSREKDGFNGTAPVNSFEAFSSPFDAVNMAGNVSEWVDGGILKGGGFLSSEEDLVITKSKGGGGKNRQGFRCVREEK